MAVSEAIEASSTDLTLLERVRLGDDGALPARIRLVLSLPEGFPEHHRPAILRAVGGCKVKKTIAAQPVFEVGLAEDEARERGMEVGHV